MYTGKLIFSQVLDFMPMHTFRRCVTRYHGDRNVRSFSCLDQYLCMAFAQLTYRESLRDIEACLRAQQQKVYHMGIRGTVAKSNLQIRNYPAFKSLRRIPDTRATHGDRSIHDRELLQLPVTVPISGVSIYHPDPFGFLPP